ncbi:RNA 2'-phosphotransferase [Natronococcus jeotgali]|uniref:Probable RNA 2'-phosphotransferase n=1 Tax=Natronococcus jeotgali DSM 18795 TaxID=1227498 RepID=L9WMD6_9EURY|nr:RNA 2'-phosphotransferase [Natronococcus jeotgali]ELY50542.1 phosphotransferase KptA/Tpt1 [Natronococcus jeotgali DSM 18795]
MTEPVRTCADHGPFATDDGTCPRCDARGTELLSGARRRRLSTYASGALRHFPEDAGLELDERGWASLEALVAAVEKKYDWVGPEHVAAVVATDPKGRFERTAGDGDDRVRAAYGHSVDIDLEPSDAPVPDELYHGTDPSNLASIRGSGLRPMSRQHVHLSASPEVARRVGRRHASDPVVLVVDAAGMLADERRIAKRGRETYTTDRVPPAYLEDGGEPVGGG